MDYNRVNNMSKVKIDNTLLILRTLYNKGPISRSDITDLTGLSSSSVTSLTKNLLREDILIEKLPENNRGVGRPRKPLAINLKDLYVVGTHISGEKYLTLILFNLKGEKLDEINFTLENFEKEYISLLLVKGIENIFADKSNYYKKTIGFGIGLSGIVDNEKGICNYSENLGWTDVKLASLLKDKIELPVKIERDVNALALAEYMDLGEKFDPLAVLMIEKGLGLGLIINGNIYSGYSGGAGEISHILDFDYNYDSISELQKNKKMMDKIINNTAEVLKITTETYDPAHIILSTNYEFEKENWKKILYKYENILDLPEKFKKDITLKKHCRENWSWSAATVVLHDFLHNHYYIDKIFSDM